MKKTETQIQTPTKQRETIPRNRTKPTRKLKEEILQVINENFIELILDMVNQNVQETLKKFQDNKNKENDKRQEQGKKP
jgi:hypothetical protein